MENMDILGLVYLGIILIFIIIGLCKGFVKSIFSVAGWIISLVLTNLVNKDVTTLLVKSNLANSFKADLVNHFNSQGELFSQEYNLANYETFADSKSLPSFIRTTIQNIIDFLAVGQEETVSTISEVISGAIVYYCFLVGSFIVLFFLFLLVFKIIGAIVGKIEEGSKAFKFVNRTLGAIFYLVIALVIIGVANYVFAIISITGSNFANWLSATMKLGTDEWTFSKFLYENNYLGEVISFILGAIF